MTVAIQHHDVTVLLGDVREQLATLPDESVNCIVTSPPYYGLRDYGCVGQIGLESSPLEYVAEMVAVFGEARRVLSDDGVLWLNLGDTYSTRVAARSSSHQDGLNGHAYDKDWTRDKARGLTRMPTFLPEKNLMGIPWRVAFALQDDGWILRNAAIWSKPNTMPSSVLDRLSSSYEHIFLFAKSRRYWFDIDPIRQPYAAETAQRYAAGYKTPSATIAAQIKGSSARSIGSDGDFGPNPLGRIPSDVWTITTQPFPGAHFATFPPEIPRRCILAGCPANGTVLDPFAGSGTTLMVARQLGRKSIGIELNPDYIDIIRGRIGPEPFNFDEVTA